MVNIKEQKIIIENPGSVKEFDNRQPFFVPEIMPLQYGFAYGFLRKHYVSCYGCVFVLYFKCISLK